MKGMKILVLMSMLLLMFCPQTSYATFTDEMSSKQITLVNFVATRSEPRMSKALKMFRQKYPDMEIVFEEVDDGREITKSLHSQNSLYDIVSIQEYMGVCARELFYNKAIQDLSQYDEINTSLTGWLDILGALSIERQIYALPDSMFPYGWRVNEQLFSDLGLTIPSSGWTWDDFYVLCKEVKEINALNKSDYKVLLDSEFPYFMLQYNLNVIDFEDLHPDYDNDTFRSLMTNWKRACDDGLLFLDNETDYYEEIPPNVLMQSKMLSFDELLDNYYILPPVIDKSTKFPVSTVCLALNSASTKSEEAAYFLACYISEAAVRAEYRGSARMYLKQSTNSDEELELHEHDGIIYETTPKNAEYWVELLENGVQEFFYAPIQREQMVSYFPQYMAGEITIDQFISRMQDNIV